jgi:hypothetical protein
VDILNARLATINAILDEREKSMNVILEMIRERIAHLNALREAYERRDISFVKREAYDIAHEVLKNRVTKMENFQSKMVGIGITLIFFSGIFGAIVGALVTFYLRK